MYPVEIEKVDVEQGFVKIKQAGCSSLKLRIRDTAKVGDLIYLPKVRGAKTGG